MTTKTIIKYADEQIRADWTELADVQKLFTDSEIVEMCNRYQDSQKHALAYRQRAKVKQQVMKERLASLEAALAAREAEESEDDEGEEA